jgi:hypothetical protein
VCCGCSEELGGGCSENVKVAVDRSSSGYSVILEKEKISTAHQGTALHSTMLTVTNKTDAGAFL